MVKDTRYSRRRKKVEAIADTIIGDDWIPARVLVEKVNIALPKAQEICINGVGNLIGTLVRAGKIEKKQAKLMGRTEVMYRKLSDSNDI